VRIVGKTNLSEFAVAPSGLNDFFGTPKNPLSKRRKLIPGGSSSGSAVAIANGTADVAFGTDTAGSIRVPAACCGVVGLKTTFGLISTKGVFPIEPRHLDTVGTIGKDVAHVVENSPFRSASAGHAEHRCGEFCREPSAGNTDSGA
jgi:amidase